MSPRIENLLRKADSEAASMGHALVWDAMGKRVAKGRCLGCGRDVTIGEGGSGPRHGEGPALQEACTRDFILKKPSLRRSALSRPA